MQHVSEKVKTAIDCAAEAFMQNGEQAAKTAKMLLAFQAAAEAVLKEMKALLPIGTHVRYKRKGWKTTFSGRVIAHNDSTIAFMVKVANDHNDSKLWVYLTEIVL